MSELIDVFGDLGTAVGTAGAAYLSIPEEQRKRKLEEQERKRKAALEDYKLGAILMPSLLKGDPAAAANMANAQMKALREAGIEGLPGDIVGGTRQVPTGRMLPTGAEQARPAPGFMGPMPEQTVPEMRTERTFDNSQTRAALAARYGIEPPKPESFELGPGHSRYTVGPDGQPRLSVTAPSIERPTAPRAPQLVKTWDPSVGGYRMVPAAEGTIIMPEPPKPGAGHEADPLVTENRIYELAERKWNRPRPVDREGGGYKHDQPDGIADNYPGVPISQAQESWRQGVETIAESLRKGGADLTPRPSGMPRRAGTTEDGRTDPFQSSAAPTGGTGRWAPQVQAAAARHGVSPALVQAVMAKESGGNPNAVNRTSGAAGLMQFMPATAQAYGIDPHNPEQAIDAGARMLSGLVKKYGSVPVALAAYNAGGGRVEEYGGKIPPFPETIDYVASITKRLGIPFDPAWVAPRHDGKPIKWPPSVRPRERVASAEPGYDVAIVGNNSGSRTGEPAPLSPRLAAFYEKHGLTPGGANA